MTDHDNRKDAVDQLSELLGSRRAAEPGELAGLVERIKVSIAREYHTDPVFHARVQLAENLMNALGPDDMREACAYLVGLQPVLDGAFPHERPATATSTTATSRLSLTVPPGTEDKRLTDTLYEYAARLTRERHEALEAMCRLSLDDPEKRGVLVVRDPETGEETMTLDASVPWKTIHDYPQGKNA